MCMYVCVFISIHGNFDLQMQPSGFAPQDFQVSEHTIPFRVADALPLGLKRRPFLAAEERSATISVQKGEKNMEANKWH